MYRYIAILLTSCLLLVSCHKEETLSGQSVVEQGYKPKPKTDLDEWIMEHLTKPYGIEVVYRSGGGLQNVQQHIYPPKPERVQAVLEAMERLWIQVYTHEQVGGIAFFKRMRPYRIYMYGGPNLDSNGVERLNSAESPTLEMSIYNVNDFDPKDETQVYILTRSLHYQFARRFIELYPYDLRKYYQISFGRYSSSSKDIAELYKSLGRKDFFSLYFYPMQQGFFTLSGMLSPEDDLVDLISIYLTHPLRSILDEIETIKEPEEDEDPVVQERLKREAEQAYRALNTKLAFAREYFSKRVGIPLELLQVIALKKSQEFSANDKED